MKFIWIFLSCFLILGCASHTPINNIPNNTQTTESIDAIQSGITRESNNITNSSNNISKTLVSLDQDSNNIQSIQNLTPEQKAQILDYIQKVKSYINIISREIDNIKASCVIILKNNNQLDLANKDVSKLEDKIKSLENDKAKYQQEEVKKLYSYLGIIAAIGSVGLLAGIAVAIFYDKKTGISIFILGVLGITVASGMIYYLKWVALAGGIVIGVVIIGIVGYVIYLVVKESNNAEINKTAVKENVNLIQEIKKDLPVESKNKIFGTDSTPGIAHTIQSPTTQAIVQEVKQESSGNP